MKVGIGIGRSQDHSFKEKGGSPTSVSYKKCFGTSFEEALDVQELQWITVEHATLLVLVSSLGRSQLLNLTNMGYGRCD